MAGDSPLTDPRRASALREALEKGAAMLAPGWAGLRQEGDFGQALIEIAARLAEHSTRRLDGIAFRDKLAFLDALDVATPAPRSATVPIVFTLAEKRQTPVFAPARVQLTARPDITFETREAIALSPARLAELVAADPAADRIERAPAYVTRGLEGPPPATRYRLLSAVEAGSRTLQLVQAVGIEPGDLLRLGAAVYRVEKAEGAIVHLLDPLGASSPAGAAVEKPIAFEMYDLRNLQEHAVYIGHKELLKLDGPAEITLVFDPPVLASRLAALDVEYHIWGTRGEGDPDWQRLEPRAIPPGERAEAAPGALRLAKFWEGSVDELELRAGASRWVRIRLRTPIAGACGPATAASSVALQVRSIAPAAEAATEGSSGIGAAFYNGQPLPTSTAFFPFGPEPQRFDIFALSAPEALSKKGAKVILDFKLDDASLSSMAYDLEAPNHVYGISVNGRLQAIRTAPPAPSIWRPLGLAPAEGAPSGGGSVRLDSRGPIHVLKIDDGVDLVFVLGKDRMIRTARVETVDGKVAVTQWQSFKHPAGKPFEAFCLIRAATAETGLFPIGKFALFHFASANLPIAYLVAADPDGFHAQAVGVGGVPVGGWTPLQSALVPGGKSALVLAAGDSDAAVLAAIDSAGAMHRGALDLAARRIEWTALVVEGAKAATTVQPLAYLDQQALVVVAARKADDDAPSPLIVVGRDPPSGDLAAALGAIGSLSRVPAPGGGDSPLILATGEKGVLIWSGSASEIAALPATVDPKGLAGLLLPPADSPRLLLAVGSELVLEGSVSSGLIEVSVEFSDLLHRAPDSPKPSHALIQTDDDRALDKLSPDWIAFEERLVQPALRTDGKAYRLLERAEETFAGTRVKNRQLHLDEADLVTSVDDILEIGGATYMVIEKAEKLVDLDADLPAGPALAYARYHPIGSQETKFLKADRKRFAKPNPRAAEPVRFLFGGAAAPKKQEIVEALDNWLLLGKPWTTVPAGETAQATLFTLPGLSITAQIRLPQESDNPDLSWEYFDGDGWQRLDRWDLVDLTGNFARTGTVTFTVPTALAPTEIAGKEDYWLRVRLIGGDYGRPTYDIVSQPPIKPDPPEAVRSTTSITIDRSRLNPPEILSVEASYVLEDAVPPDRVVADSNLAAVDQTQAALERGAVFNLFEGVAQHVGDGDGGTRALYLGLSRAPAVAALSLYADAVDQDDDPRELVVEALTREGWSEIGSDDETKGLTRPGMLRLDLDPPPEQLPLFGRDGWWLRLRPGRNAAAWAPRLLGLYVNAVVAEHARSVRQEMLGSSLGEPHQSYRLAQRPVLPATLELRVRESLGEEERSRIEQTGGRDSVRDGDPNLPGLWVRWDQVDTFVDQGGDARVYRLDPATGEIRFGDGRFGKVPPAGADSIRAFGYQKGGGSAGNVEARAIDTLAGAIESVELAINPVDAAGGADAPPAERLATTAPALLRHGGRALAPADIEALAVGSSPDVVRARCLARKGCGIDLAVAIRRTGARCPMPSRARREGIARYIAGLGWGALEPNSIRVRGPRYLKLRVEAAVLARSAEAAAGVQRACHDRLAALLDPLEGGPDGLGWPFGRRIWPSDVERVLAGLEGVDRVISVELTPLEPGRGLDFLPPDGLVCADPADIDLLARFPGDGR